jgi:predicted DCC family thiol-disulfide oxidoreductase YuxK
MQTIKIIYDKDCYLCSNFQAYLELKKQFKIEFVDMNMHQDLVKSYAEKGFILDNGMVLDIDGKIYQGQEAVMQIEKLIGKQTWFDSFFSFCMRTPWLVAIGYPIAHAIRRVLLWWRRLRS